MLITLIFFQQLPEIPSFKSKVRKRKSEKSPSEDQKIGNESNPGFVTAIRRSLHDVVVSSGIDGLLTEAPKETIAKSGVTFSTHETEMRGNGSINRTISSDDDNSDIDDVPEAKPSGEVKVDKQDGQPAIKATSHLAEFFASMQYRTISLILGPMQCFFYISYVFLPNTFRCCFSSRDA